MATGAQCVCKRFPDKLFNIALTTTNGFPAFLTTGTPVSQALSSACSWPWNSGFVDRIGVFVRGTNFGLFE